MLQEISPAQYIEGSPLEDINGHPYSECTSYI